MRTRASGHASWLFPTGSKHTKASSPRRFRKSVIVRKDGFDIEAHRGLQMECV